MSFVLTHDMSLSCGTSVLAVTVNGAPYTKATRRRIGFVLQDDVLFESLTVKVRRIWDCWEIPDKQRCACIAASTLL